MNYDQKIMELTQRIEKLEKAENKRIIKRRIEIITKVIIGIILLIMITMGYIYVNNNFIKPYKEKIDYVNQKVDNVESFINDKLGGLNKYNPFK